MRSQRFFTKVSFILILLLVPITSISQTAGGTARFSRGVILKKNGSRFNANNLVFSEQTLSFQDPKSQQTTQLPLSEIEYVRSKTGSHALEGALIGGGLFLLAGLAAVLEAESDPTVEVENTEQALLIITGIGFGGGLLIGTAFPKEKTVFQYNRLITQRSRPQDFNFTGRNREIAFISWRFAF